MVQLTWTIGAPLSFAWMQAENLPVVLQPKPVVQAKEKTPPTQDVVPLPVAVVMSSKLQLSFFSFFRVDGKNGNLRVFP
ncbi:MAG: hypothetical protein AAF514_16145 [Verrucomicrobiota bacterium]